MSGATRHTVLLLRCIKHLQATTVEMTVLTRPVMFLLLPWVVRHLVLAVSVVWTLLKSMS